MPDNPNTVEPRKIRRRWYQFRLRTLLMGVMLCAFVGWLIRLRDPVDRRPGFPADDSDVAQMTATLLGVDGDFEKGGRDVLQNQIPLVLETLAAGRVDHQPADWKFLGLLKYRMNSGQTVAIDLFYVDGKEMAFRTDGEHYFRGVDAHKLAALLGWNLPSESK